METRSRKRRDSDAGSVASSVGSTASEPVLARSRSTTPFTLRSQCSRHGSACPEGHGMTFRSRLSPSPRRSSPKRSTTKKPTPTSRPKSVKPFKKNLFPMVEEENYHNNKDAPLPSLVVSSIIVTQTSDYSSAEEELGFSKTSSTPTNSHQPRLSPLQRSAEKTDYTYAQSYSYRTVVTPERVIMMPNMTRKTIERPHSGERFSSPELKLTPSLYNVSFSSRATGNQERSRGVASYGTDFDSDDDGDQSYNSYQLNAPPSRQLSSKAHFVTRRIYSEVRELAFSICRWIYLTNCYLLLLDTDILQSSGITKLRSICRQLARNTRLLLSLFFLVPLCLFAGGLLYSALHAFNAHFLSHTTPSANLAASSEPFREEFSTPQPPIAVPVPGCSDTLPPCLSTSTKATVEDDLKLTEAIKAMLDEKLSGFAERLESLNAVVNSVQGDLRALDQGSKEFADQTVRQKVMSDVDERFNALASQLAANQPKSDVYADVVRILEKIQTEVKALNEWKHSIKSQTDAMVISLSDLKDKVEKSDQILSDLVASEFDKAIRKWESESQSKWFQSIEEKLLVEVSHRIQIQRANSGNGLNREEVERLIHSALELYDSDKTGLADYALEPAGGMVLSTRCTEAFSSHRPRLSIWGFTLWSESNNPRVVIQPGIVPGQCWSFRGFDGYLVIQLSRRIVPTAFTLEHIPRSLAPDGQIDSAPRNFTVYGLSKENDPSGVQLGQYTYDSMGEPLQTFQVQEPNPGVFHVVELRIHSNYGNLNYTCLYRFRVHGKVA